MCIRDRPNAYHCFNNGKACVVGDCNSRRVNMLSESCASWYSIRAFWKAAGFSKSSRISSCRPVSYTHLDVYKRQVYLVTQEGFDTHSNQVVAHSNLLHHLAGGLDSFARAMQRGGRWNDVVVMTYSEFGRRAQENRGKGTDCLLYTSWLPMWRN